MGLEDPTFQVNSKSDLPEDMRRLLPGMYPCPFFPKSLEIVIGPIGVVVRRESLLGALVRSFDTAGIKFPEIYMWETLKGLDDYVSGDIHAGSVFFKSYEVLKGAGFDIDKIMELDPDGPIGKKQLQNRLKYRVLVASLTGPKASDSMFLMPTEGMMIFLGHENPIFSAVAKYRLLEVCP